MFHERKTIIRCCEPGCFGERHCYGRCIRHYRAMDPAEVARLKSMTRAEREAEFNQVRIHPPIPKFEYEGDEAALAAMIERQE
jgi:hypothetical protein